MFDRKNINKIAAITICIYLTLVLSFSFLFIVTHEKHNCTGHDCPICEQLHIAESIIQQIKSAMISIIALTAAIISIYYSIKVVYIFEVSNTLIKRKVRLND